MKNFILTKKQAVNYFCAALLMATLSACWIVPKKVARTIYFDLPERSKDLLVDSKSIYQEVNANNSVINVEDAESHLEYGSRKYFSSDYLISQSKLNVIESYGDNILLGYQDGGIFEVDSISRFGLGSEPALKVKKIATGTKPILSMRVSPNGKYVAVSQFSVVTIVDLKELKIVAQLNRVKGRILKLTWSPDSSVLLMGRANGDVFSWALDENIAYTLDSLDVLEIYETEASPVVDVAFHPSGRAFFVALENGSLFLVRLLKTEVELGLREEKNNFDIDKGGYVQKFGSAEGGISSFIIQPEKDELLVVSFAGVVYRWRIRGLKKIDMVDIGSEASTYASLVEPNFSGQSTDLMIGIGRSLRLKLSCLIKDYLKLMQPTTEVISREVEEVVDEEKDTSPQVLDDLALLSELNSEIQKKEIEKKVEEKGAAKDLNLVLETAKYLESTSVMQLNRSTGVLWVGGKSGNLSGFYLKDFLQDSTNSQRIKAICK